MAAPSASASAPLLRYHPHRRALFPSSPRHRAGAASLLEFPPHRPSSSRRLSYTAVRSSSTASPSAPVEESAASAAPTGDAEEQERVVLPTNESSDLLLRIRHTDDAHIFCLEDQIQDEIRGVLDLTEQILGQFGFRYYEINLSTRPEKSVGSDDIWDKATIALKNALDDKGWEYKVDEGGGAFYGPKIDLKIEDALGRKWQCSTVQVDFNLPERFDITYVDSNTEKRRPIMIHRAILGSLERFFGVLIEHYAGDFPLWLAPTQARILPVTDNELQYCNEVASELKSRGFRVEVCHGERLPKLIRNAETQKVPLMAVVGPKEVQARTLTIRSRHNGEMGTMPVDEFITRLQLAVANKSSL